MVDYERQELNGTNRNRAPGAQLIGPYPPDEIIEVTVVLKPNVSGEYASNVLPSEELSALPLRQRKYFNRETYEKLYSASGSDIALVIQFANEFSLTPIGSCGAQRLLKFRGSVANMEQAFGTQLFRYRYPFGEYRGREHELSVPKDVAEVIQAVFGLDNRKQSKPFLHDSGVRSLAMTSSLVDLLIKRYDFPQNLAGVGETIGILEFGGGFSPSDYSTYFQLQGVSPPQVKSKSVGALYVLGTCPRDDKEVALDVEVTGTVAPKATIVVYFAPNTEMGWVDALCAAVYDKENNPTVLSVSWGHTEEHWEPDKRLSLDQILQQATQVGMTVCAASGDNGCEPNVRGEVRVNFPASSPYILACGGTAFQNDRVERVWNDGIQAASGGGESDVEPHPNWQDKLVVPPPLPRRTTSFNGRLLPDVAGFAAGLYAIYSGDGYVNRVGGTSAVAPLWAGLIARLNEGLRGKGSNRIGYFNPLLYASPSLQHTFNDVFEGDNAPPGITGYSAGLDWDPCTGWGSPNGQALLDMLLKR